MLSLDFVDILLIILFFLTVIGVGFWAGRKYSNEADDYLLSGRQVGLKLFVMTTVSTWYGGILGVGEFTYRYGIVSWFTQGFPYYIFALLFAIFFAKKIRQASLFTIPDKLTEVYGKQAGVLSAVIVFLLVSPAPYIFMTANLISLIFDINLIYSLIISLAISVAYLFKGGYRADLYTDVVQFFVMFAGFILILIFSYSYAGGLEFLTENLPPEHLTLDGGTSFNFILVWFFIAMWTFADPGFHQRCYAAKSGNIAMKGIIISVLFWFLFDFLTTTTGLYSRALIPDIETPVSAYPLLSEIVLPHGLKGIFYAAMFATIISTANSFLFLSATTIGRDFIFRLSKDAKEVNLKSYTIVGLMISGSIAILLAYSIPSVIQIWYTIGSLLIPAIILPVVSAYYPLLRVKRKFVISEMIIALFASTTWYLIRDNFDADISIIEPMLAGLFFAALIHSAGLLKKIFSSKEI
ncbi:MAG: sodium:solute symporter family protein [Ignavibacteriales bacterium]|nr:MAG: sodium:solute symporter family protein [Ignavibacteriales bacterium]